MLVTVVLKNHFACGKMYNKIDQLIIKENKILKTK